MESEACDNTVLGVDKGIRERDCWLKCCQGDTDIHTHADSEIDELLTDSMEIEKESEKRIPKVVKILLCGIYIPMIICGRMF